MPAGLKHRTAPGSQRRADEAAVPLICLPFAGAGPSFFNDWAPLTESLQIIAPSFPGREKRFLEEPYHDAGEAITHVLPELLDLIGQRNRVLIFGHSLGAVLAFELAWRMRSDCQLQIEQLVVSGSPGPWTPRQRRATGLDDQAFLDQVSEFAGYDHPALNDPDMRELLLPLLRADVEMHENYLPPKDRVLDVPITTVRGTNDELVSADEAAQWKSATTMPLQSLEIDGGHMYLANEPEKLLRLIERLIMPVADSGWSLR